MQKTSQRVLSQQLAHTFEQRRITQQATAQQDTQEADKELEAATSQATNLSQEARTVARNLPYTTVSESRTKNPNDSRAFINDLRVTFEHNTLAFFGAEEARRQSALLADELSSTLTDTTPKEAVHHTADRRAGLVLG